VRSLSHSDVAVYLEWIRKGEGLSRAARLIGVSPASVREARKANLEFDEMVKAAEVEAAEPVEGKLYQAALQGEPWAVKLWLERRSSDRWSPAPQTVKVEHSLTPGTEQIVDLAQRLEARRQLLGLNAGFEVLDADVVED